MSDSPRCAFSLSLEKMDIGRIPPFVTLASLLSGARTSASLCSLTEAYKSDSMNTMNEIAAQPLRLRDFMSEDDGWGRVAGREAYGKLIDFVETHPGSLVFRVSLVGVHRIDISFASETIVELAHRHRGRKGFCFVDLADADQKENWAAAAQRAAQPIMSWDERGKSVTLGLEPSQGNSEAFRFALARPETRAAEYAASAKDVSITNASTKFKQLWEQGFLLRREAAAESGGVEYVYVRIK